MTSGNEGWGETLQKHLSFELLALTSVSDVCMAISGMAVRGAPLTGAAVIIKILA